MNEKALNIADISTMLENIPSWYMENDKLARDFEFRDFKAAVEFVDKIAELADAEKHHPDILIHSWNKVKIILYTHSINGLSKNDFRLAEKINNFLNTKNTKET